jgi:arginase
LPITLSGNCNTGVLAALAHNTGANLGIVWFDAHSDAETPETSTSGFLDGMGLAMALGRCWRPMLESAGIAPVPGCRVVLVGAREISEAAGRLLGDTGVAVIPPAEVREVGIAAGIDQLQKAGVTRLHVHVDVDVLDCDRVGRANAYALPDGLMPDQLVAAIRSLTGAFALTSASLASYDPETDPSGRVAEAAVQTLVEIASSAQPG